MRKKELLDLLDLHKKNLTTVKQWDEYAKSEGLPPAVTIIYHFGSWTNVKRELGLTPIKRNYSYNELEQIAIKHKEHFYRKSIWDVYSKKHGLPASATFIKAFGSWIKVKEHIGVNTDKRKDDLYTKEDIKNILEKHAENFVNRKQWDEYVKEKRLPTYKTIKKHFDYEEILKIVGKKKPAPLTKEELIKIALKHEEQFLGSSMAKWDVYADSYGLPSSYIFFKSFGSWKKAKYEIRIRSSKKPH